MVIGSGSVGGEGDVDVGGTRGVFRWSILVCGLAARLAGEGRRVGYVGCRWWDWGDAG
jgi:hypothetical protein